MPKRSPMFVLSFAVAAICLAGGLARADERDDALAFCRAEMDAVFGESTPETIRQMGSFVQGCMIGKGYEINTKVDVSDNPAVGQSCMMATTMIMKPWCYAPR